MNSTAREAEMQDVVFIAFTIGLFVVMFAYTTACERLR